MTTAVMQPRGSEAKRERHDITVNVRMPTPVRNLIDTAAAATGKSRSEFIIESAKQQAIDVLLDQRLFFLNDDQFDEFQRALDSPLPPNDRLKALLRKKPLWEP